MQVMVVFLGAAITDGLLAVGVGDAITVGSGVGVGVGVAVTIGDRKSVV